MPPRERLLAGVPDSNVPVAGDFDGDGLTDLALYNKYQGYFYAILLNVSIKAYSVKMGTGNTSSNPNLDDTPLVGDYNADGKMDFAVYDPSTTAFLWSPSTGNSGGTVSTLMTLPSSFSSSIAHVFLTGNYQGTGIDFAIYDPTTSISYVYTTDGTLIDVFQLGSGQHRNKPL